jgi:hypothetical protein
MFEAVALILAALIGSGSTTEAGEMAAKESEAARKEARGLADITRQDTLAQQAAAGKLSKGYLDIAKQSLGLQRQQFTENKRQFDATQNQALMSNVFSTIGDATSKSMVFKNFLLSRKRV